MLSSPESTPRISPKMIESGQNLGSGVQLRHKFRFLIVIGVFGKRASLHTVCRQMYVTSTFDAPREDKKTGKSHMAKFVDDASAYLRLDNICRDGHDAKSLIQAELDFLRLCFGRLFGTNAMAFISDDLLLQGTMLQLLKLLSGSTTSVDWTGVDPILALEAIAASSQDSLSIEIARRDGTRWTKQAEGVEPIQPDAQVDIFPTGAGYKLFINAQNSAERPLVFEFLDSGEAKTDDGHPVRAQLLPLPIREDDGEGPWRVSHRLNRPLTMGKKEGRFGFFAISGLGLALVDLLPDGHNPKCLSDDDLRCSSVDAARHSADTRNHATSTS